LDINELFETARRGVRHAEESLFEALTERFRLFVEQRIKDPRAREDVVQESLMTIAKKYREVELTRSFAAWSYGVLQNYILHYYRSRQYHTDRFERPSPHSEIQAVSEPDPVLASDLRDCLRELRERKLNQARVLNLLFQGYTVKEVCQRLGLTPNACHIQLSRARAQLKACLKRKRGRQ
jgi:RNA polymerase sigma factor (sigma-70 family)